MKNDSKIYMVQFGVAFEGIQSTRVYRTLEAARAAAGEYVGQDWEEYPCEYDGIIHWASEIEFAEIIEGKIED